MVASEREMVRKLQDEEAGSFERTTSLQPTYEDTVAMNPEEDWDGVDE